MHKRIARQRQLELLLLFNTCSVINAFSTVLISYLFSRQKYLYMDQASASLFVCLFVCLLVFFFFLGEGVSFFQWSLDLMNCRISLVTKGFGFGRPRILTVMTGACSSITLLNEKLYSFNLSSGTSK